MERLRRGVDDRLTWQRRQCRFAKSARGRSEGSIAGEDVGKSVGSSGHRGLQKELGEHRCSIRRWRNRHRRDAGGALRATARWRDQFDGFVYPAFDQIAPKPHG